MPFRIHVALHEPEIPPNTGNIIRLCANTGACLHLVGKLGFSLDDARLRRAGLDYHEYTNLRCYPDLASFRERFRGSRLLAFSTRGRTRYDAVDYRPGDILLFGPETRGLPEDLLDDLPDQQTVYIPQQPHSRSLNLSNAVAIATFEAWRQAQFAGSPGCAR